MGRIAATVQANYMTCSDAYVIFLCDVFFEASLVSGKVAAIHSFSIPCDSLDGFPARVNRMEWDGTDCGNRAGKLRDLF